MPMAMRARTIRRGFTLIEAALAIVIVGVGAVAMMQLHLVCTSQNIQASQVTAAGLLAGHVREMTATLPFNDPAVGQSSFGAEPGESIDTFDDIDDFDDAVFSPPLDARRQPLTDMSDFVQRVRVRPVARNTPGGNLDGSAITDLTYTGSVRVTVDIFRAQDGGGVSGEPMFRVSWVRVDQ
jgi:prepilin-type N-terminal cleavage/methylation domain-containing protein